MSSGQSGGPPATAEVITPGQLVAGMAVLTICGNFFLFPTTAIMSAGRTGWMLTIPAAAFALFLGLLTFQILRAVPGRLLPDVILELLGPTAGRVLAGLLCVAFSVSAAIDYRVGAEPVSTTFFDHTPLWVIVLLLGIPTAYFAWTGPVRMARLYPAFAIFILVGLLIAVLAGAVNCDYGYLRPLTVLDRISTHDPQLWASMLMIRSALALGFLMPYLTDQSQGLRLFAIGLGYGSIPIALVAAIPVATFGPEGARLILRPFMESLATLQSPNLPLTRLEFPLRLIFQANVIAAIALQEYAAASLLSRALAFRDNWLGIFAVSAPAVAAAGWFASDPDALVYIELGIIILAALSVVVFGGLWILARTKLARERSGWPAREPG